MENLELSNHQLVGCGYKDATGILIVKSNINEKVRRFQIDELNTVIFSDDEDKIISSKDINKMDIMLIEAMVGHTYRQARLINDQNLIDSSLNIFKLLKEIGM